MARKKKRAPAVEPSGAPEWMVTFSDCMTLLLTFFVLLLSFSSFDVKDFVELRKSFARALPSVRQEDAMDTDSFLESISLMYVESIANGSEKSTLEKGKKDNTKQESDPDDFRKQKVFLFPSSTIFWGTGSSITPDGRDGLENLASFLRGVPSRIVISENSGVTDKESEQLGLLRAWAVMDYLTTKEGLNKNWFSISAMSTMGQDSFERNARDRQTVESERMVEVVLLERSLYN